MSERVRERERIPGLHPNLHHRFPIGGSVEIREMKIGFDLLVRVRDRDKVRDRGRIRFRGIKKRFKFLGNILAGRHRYIIIDTLHP
jgi:hypothetical protein